MENILELQQVSKTFSKSKFSLENVSFNLPYGAIMGFVGENGAGKTTTILLLVVRSRPLCQPFARPSETSYPLPVRQRFAGSV